MILGRPKCQLNRSKFRRRRWWVSLNGRETSGKEMERGKTGPQAHNGSDEPRLLYGYMDSGHNERYVHTNCLAGSINARKIGVLALTVALYAKYTSSKRIPCMPRSCACRFVRNSDNPDCPYKVFCSQMSWSAGFTPHSNPSLTPCGLWMKQLTPSRERFLVRTSPEGPGFAAQHAALIRSTSADTNCGGTWFKRVFFAWASFHSPF